MGLLKLGRLYALTTLCTGLLAGCSSNTSIAPTGGTSQPAAKTTIKGLVTMGDISFQSFGIGTPDNSQTELNAHPNLYAASVINVTWAQLEPTQGTFDFSSIDSALTVLNTYNATYPQHPVVAKLRVWEGQNVPAWVFPASGGTVTLKGHNAYIQFPEFWTSAYHTAWVPLQTALAARYDGNAMINQVSITSCSSLTFEPFIRPVDATSVTNLRAAGYTDAQALTCLQNAVADYSGWTKTPLEFAFSPLPHFDTGFDVEETTTPINLMTAERASLGSRFMVANEGLNDPNTTVLAPIYAAFLTVGPPLQLETVNPFVPWDQTVALGVTYHPTQIEIWDTTAVPGGDAPLSTAQLQSYAAMIAAD